MEDSTKQIVQKAAQTVGSLKETEFDIMFNPDMFSSGLVHPKDQGQHKKECQLIQDATDFLITVQVPAFICDCLDHSTAPMDGQTLAAAIHNRGINVRYLGKITEMLAKVPQRTPSRYTMANLVTLTYLLTRSVAILIKVLHIPGGSMKKGVK